MKMLTSYLRILLGLVYALNGLNWFFKIITPYPSASDFVNFLPPPDVVGAMIEQGVLFQAAKAVELVGGILLLANRWVPLTLVVQMAVTVPVFIVDVFKPELRLRAFLMGTGGLLMNISLLIAHYHYYRPLLNWHSYTTQIPKTEPVATPDGLAIRTGQLAAMLQTPLAVISALLGTVMVIWLLYMVGEYALDPKAIHEIRQMIPRTPQ
jgi:uncharacterized membrane protein YphA (DoxX/SURF4 family)